MNPEIKNKRKEIARIRRLKLRKQKLLMYIEAINRQLEQSTITSSSSLPLDCFFFPISDKLNNGNAGANLTCLNLLKSSSRLLNGLAMVGVGVTVGGFLNLGAPSRVDCLNGLGPGPG